MRHHFKGKDFLKLADFTPEEVGYLVDTAIDLKRRHATGQLSSRSPASNVRDDLREAQHAHARASRPAPPSSARRPST